MVVIFATACGLDNYELPNRQINVHILSRTDKVPVLTENTRTNMISYNLMQTDEEYPQSGQELGWHDDHGVVHMNFWDGNYLFFPPKSRGSWKIPANGNDTIPIIVNGKKLTEVEYLVDPYYLFENVEYTLSGNTVTATGNIKEYNPATMTNLYLAVRGSIMLGQTRYDQRINITNPTTGAFTISLDVTPSKEKPALYARVMVQISGKSDWQMGPIGLIW